ncbi:hypothetical protein [Flavisolibacter ginsengisoli]|jgi:hypothetical protein|uniref:Uncharacterized protein n=1 Tax=Flavisolibacter ginsengisoli DSM 18119 TaxID=1121884 RepID=A0A1M5FRY9_9BACT|nr:hypothetical protein [Flavisolibacter ginsengisoli]SHF94189.1 hypothetical protein SAMN02745131_03922 [Flavisolibacter ginsengisoli DSM 18119]
MNHNSALRRKDDISSLQPLISLSAFEKGEAFEKFVASLFNLKSKRFELLHYNSENAILYGLAAAKCLYPDLKFLFYTKDRPFKFAIECKWKQSFGTGHFQWADSHRIKNYMAYEKRNHIPMFIAIGIGGHPASPDKLYLTPLSHFGYKTEVFERDLIPYRRNPKRRFFYDARQLKLF